MPNLPTLTPAEIEAELKGTERYGDTETLMDLHDLELGDWCAVTATYFNALDDALLNAARAIRLARENEEMRVKLQDQHQATWAMAIEAAAKNIEPSSKNPKEWTDFGRAAAACGKSIRALPCPPLEIKGE